MTQYPPPPPSPYQPLHRGPTDPFAPAKRAMLLMLFVGVAGVLLGVCSAGYFPIMNRMMDAAPPEQAAQAREQLSQAQKQSGMTFEQLELASRVAGVLLLIAGGVIGGLSFAVRQGKRGPALAAAVLTGMAMAYLVINGLVGLATGQILPVLCVVLLPLAVLGMLLQSLIAVIRNAAVLEAMRDGRSPAGVAFGPRHPPAGGYPPSGFPPAAPPQAPTLPTGYGLLPPPPPPPGEPSGRYGYATRPPAAQQSSPPPAGESSAGPSADRPAEPGA